MADIERSIKLGIDTGDSLATLGKLKKELANLYVDLEGAERGSVSFDVTAVSTGGTGDVAWLIIN